MDLGLRKDETGKDKKGGKGEYTFNSNRRRILTLSEKLTEEDWGVGYVAFCESRGVLYYC